MLYKNKHLNLFLRSSIVSLFNITKKDQLILLQQFSFYLEGICGWGWTFWEQFEVISLDESNKVGYKIMYAFSFWHTYYDSAFTAHPLKIPNILYSELQISNKIQKWPSLTSLPQLPKLFQLLEQTIQTEDNWLGCILSEKEMQDIEFEVNLIVVNLQCEKKYGLEFWDKYPRRVESSIVHFYLYFKIFISVLIPTDCDTLLEASRKEKLAFSFKKLEGLVNDIIGHLKHIHGYLFQSQFSEQQKLIKQFFSDFLELLQILPTTSKQKLTKTSRLMQFICIINPLEADKVEASQSQSSIRRKNATAFDNKKEREKRHSEDKSRKGSSDKVSVQNYEDNSFGKINKKVSVDKVNKSFSPPKDIAKKMQLFKFKQKVRKYSFYKNAKKPTISSYDTKDKTGSIQKQRSPSNQRSLSFVDQYQMKRTETLPAGRSKQLSFYVQRRSREVSSKSIHPRDKSPSRMLSYDKEEVQHERQVKIKKKKATKLTIKTMPVSNVHDFVSGKSRGWGFVRQWFKGRLANRKLQKLLKQF